MAHCCIRKYWEEQERCTRVTPKVSVIVPIYNAESTIGRCAKSLFKQTFKEVEFLFVDDGSPDRSMRVLDSILAEFPERKDQVFILHHATNRGVAAARNTGLAQVRGEYLIHADADDWAERGMIQEMYEHAKVNACDLVWCDFWVDLPNKPARCLYRKQVADENAEFIIKRMLSGSLHAGLWNKLVKRSLFVDNNILFPDGIDLREDMGFLILSLMHAKKVEYLPKAFYHYVQNAGAITTHPGREKLQSQFALVGILERRLPVETYGRCVSVFKARLKKEMFFSGLFSDDEYLRAFPESTPYMYDDSDKYAVRAAIWLSLRRYFVVARMVMSLASFVSKAKHAFMSESWEFHNEVDHF